MVLFLVMVEMCTVQVISQLLFKKSQHIQKMNFIKFQEEPQIFEKKHNQTNNYQFQLLKKISPLSKKQIKTNKTTCKTITICSKALKSNVEDERDDVQVQYFPNKSQRGEKKIKELLGKLTPIFLALV